MGHPKMANKPANKSTVSSGKIDAKSESVSFELSVSAEGLEPILGAAYLLTDRAFVLLEGDREKKLRVSLSPKAGGDAKSLKALGETFRLELGSQKVRWAIAKLNQPIREFVTEQAVLLANGRLPAPAADAPAADQLSDEQRKEIERLIAEVEDEIKTLNEKKTPKDPKNIAATWEEKQSARTAGASAKGSGAAKGGGSAA